mmetsp:Transcript_16429/g.29091  ORF Transcript_16429/g.29091 Transcript_16429/m.29091 type:complete len:526 (+) Transcript_16429:232-1809(+)
MERVLAGVFAEGTSYLSTLWSNATGNGSDALRNGGGKGGDDDGAEKVDKVRSTTRDSAVSTTSTSSRVSIASTSGVKKVSKVVSWIAFGAKKKKAPATGCGAYDGPDGITATNKKSPLDILLAASAKRPDDAVSPGNLKALSVVGRGGYGKVMLMRDHTTGKLLAVKEVAKSNLIDKPGTHRSVRQVSTKIEHAEMERMVLATVSSHPFITSFHGSFQNRDKIFLMLEYASGGELFGAMQKHGVFSEPRVRLYSAEIVLALEFLHENGIIYRDLKPENILLDARGHVRLTDFGLSIAFNKVGDDNTMRCVSICGTPEYISPEIVLGATTHKNDRSWTYGKTVDYWALGVLTYEMLYRVPPFFHRDRKTMLNKILECKLEFPKPSEKQPSVSTKANEFIAALLKYEERDRLGFGSAGAHNVKAHPFFQPLEWSKVAASAYEPEYVPELGQDCDTANFDECFTKELLRQDNCSSCAYNLELTGYDYLPEAFDESHWYTNQTEQQTADLNSVPNPEPAPVVAEAICQT